MNTISDLVSCYLRTNRYAESERDTAYGRRYKALCAAFGVPLNWEEDQEERRERLMWATRPIEIELHNAKQPYDDELLWSNLSDVQKQECSHTGYYMRFREALQRAFNHGDGGMRGFSTPVRVAVDDVFRTVYVTLTASLLEADVTFFSGVYGIDARRTFSETELSAFGAMSAADELAFETDCFPY
jgi:hypothetical protein